MIILHILGWLGLCLLVLLLTLVSGVAALIGQSAAALDNWADKLLWRWGA